MKTNTRSWISRTLALAAITLLLVTNAEAAVSFDYAGVAGSSILFPGGGTFTFTPPADNFNVTSGSAAGDLGSITGVFSIGTITTFGPVSTAPVSGAGLLSISDGVFDLTASLKWINIQLVGGTGGSLNITGKVNLSGITYAGADPDLAALAAAGSGIDTLSFQFPVATTLATLKNGPGPNSTSFSGTIAAAVPDGGTTVGLLSLGLLGVGIIYKRIKPLPI